MYLCLLNILQSVIIWRVGGYTRLLIIACYATNTFDGIFSGKIERNLRDENSKYIPQ